MFKKIKTFNNTFNFNWSLNGVKFWVQFRDKKKTIEIYNILGEQLSESQTNTAWLGWSTVEYSLVDMRLQATEVNWNSTQTYYLKYDLLNLNLALYDQFNNLIMQIGHASDGLWSQCGQFLFIFYVQAHTDKSYGQLYNVGGQKLGASILWAGDLQWGAGHVYAVSKIYNRYKIWPKFLHGLLNFCYRSDYSYVVSWLYFYDTTQLYNYAGQSVGKAWRKVLSLSFNQLNHSYFVNFLNDTHLLYNSKHLKITNSLSGVAQWSPCGTKYFLLINQNKIKNGYEPVYLAQLYKDSGVPIGTSVNLVSAIYWNELGTFFIVHFNNYSCQVYNAKVESIGELILGVKDVFWSPVGAAFVLRRFYPGKPEKGEFLELYNQVA